MGSPDIIAPSTTSGGTPVGGSGTPGTIPVWSSGTTLTDSPLTVSGTTVTATQAFTVNGTQTFNGNLVSGFNQTWTLNGGFLNIQSGLLYLDKTNSRIGIGTASPYTRAEINYGTLITVNGTTPNTTTSLTLSANDPGVTASGNGVLMQMRPITNRGAVVAIGAVNGDANKDANGALTFYYNSANGQIAEGMRLNSSGYVGIGTASPSAKLEVPFTGSLAGMRIQISSANYFNATNHFFRTLGDNNLVQISGNYIDASLQANYGLRLPATPGVGDANTLDAYREGTRVLAAGDLSGWTYVTATQYWTLVGRTVTLHTVFTGGTSSATGGATIATPPLLTPLRIAAGVAVNSAGTALGNGVAVVGPTSGTTGTVTTSNAISSSAVDKVITVTYETAGL
jgi:hypothetical protein